MSAKKAAAGNGGERRITEAEAERLAKQYEDVADAISKHVETNFKTLSAKEINDLTEKAIIATALSADMTAKAVLVSLRDANKQVGTIIAATAKANGIVRTIKKVGTVIDIITAVITLGTAIVANDPGAIVEGIGGLVDKVGNLGDEKDKDKGNI